MDGTSGSGGAVYQPELPAEEIERLRRWHEDAYRSARGRAGTEGQDFDYLGLELHVPPSVQPITPMSQLLGEAVVAEVQPGDRVLDMGTGCGVNAILAARAGGDVLAVDINPEAVTATVENAARNGVTQQVEARVSDVFDAVDRERDGPFDVIIFDPPFRWFEPRDLLEAATADPGYRALTCFVREVRSYQSEGGRVLLFFGSSGDLGYVQYLMDKEGFTVEEVAHETLMKDDVEVKYVTYRLRSVRSSGQWR